MKTLISSLLLAASTALTPAFASTIHDFTPENRRPTTTAVSNGTGRCLNTRDKSLVCYLKVSNRHYSLAIHDVDHPGYATSVFIDCQTGVWKSWGILKKPVLDQYMHGFCTSV